MLNWSVEYIEYKAEWSVFTAGYSPSLTLRAKDTIIRHKKKTKGTIFKKVSDTRSHDPHLMSNVKLKY